MNEEHVIPGTPYLGQLVAVRFNGSTYAGTVVESKIIRGGRWAGHSRVMVEIYSLKRTVSRVYVGTPVWVRHARRCEPGCPVNRAHAYLLAEDVEGGAR